MTLKCNPDDLERSPKWIFEDDPAVRSDDAHLCFRTDPRMVLIHRRRASSKSFSNTFRSDTLSRARNTAMSHHVRAQKIYSDFLCKEENPDAVKAALSRGRGKAKYVQDATCRFADDPERVLSSRDRDDSIIVEFPLYDTFRAESGDNGHIAYCDWTATIPRLEGMTVLKMLGFKKVKSLPYVINYKVGGTYVPPDTDDFSAVPYWSMIKTQRKLRASSAESLDAFLKRFEVVDGQLSPRLTHFFDFMYQAADCRFRSFIPIRFSKECRVKKVFMDDKGNVKEICGENAGEHSQTDDVVSPLSLLSDIYYIELLYDHNDNKRRKYNGQYHPSFWRNPPKEDIEEAFSRGWVALPNDKILEFDRTKNADEAGLRSLKTVKSKKEYLEILADLCCSSANIMLRGFLTKRTCSVHRIELTLRTTH